MVAGIFGSSLTETLRHEVRLRGPRTVPEIVEHCTDFIRDHGLETEGVFRSVDSLENIPSIFSACTCASRGKKNFCLYFLGMYMYLHE